VLGCRHKNAGRNDGLTTCRGCDKRTAQRIFYSTILGCGDSFGHGRLCDFAAYPRQRLRNSYTHNKLTKTRSARLHDQSADALNIGKFRFPT